MGGGGINKWEHVKQRTSKLRPSMWEKVCSGVRLHTCGLAPDPVFGTIPSSPYEWHTRAR